MTSLDHLKTKAPRWSLNSGLVCLILMGYLALSAHQVNWHLTPGQVGLAWVLLIIAILTALMSILAIPRWQAFIALAIAILTLWWLFTSSPKPDVIAPRYSTTPHLVTALLTRV